VPGIYFGKPRGFGTNDKGEDIGFNTEVYSASEVTPPSIRYSTILPMTKKIYIYLRCHLFCCPSLNWNQLGMQDVVRRRISIPVSRTLYLILFKLRMHSFVKFWSFCVSSPD